MKTLFLILTILLSLNSFARVRIVAHPETYHTQFKFDSVNDRTFLLVAFDFGKYAVYYVEGDHYGELDYVITHRNLLTHKSALLFFPAMSRFIYVRKRDEKLIEYSLGISELTNK